MPSSFLLVLLSLVSSASATCRLPGFANLSSVGMPAHVLKDPDTLDHFRQEVLSLSWKCPFPTDLLTSHLEADSRLYSNDTVLLERRKGVARWLRDDAQWAELILRACLEIAEGRGGPNSRTLEDLRLMEALSDYVEHLHCFGVVAMVMRGKGREVTPLSQDSSRVHDIDKLDPIMLTGYSERFEDGASTSVWEECVGRHTLVNPHHQAHPMWHVGEYKENCQARIAEAGLREMVCDKVSRKLQKELGGVVSDAMWDVDPAYFDGLPRYWLDKALAILDSMKKTPPFYSS